MNSVNKIIKLAAIFQKKIAQQDSEAVKMLNWIINDSPIQFGKPEAREILNFIFNKKGPVPDASKMDRVGAALVMYFYSVYGYNAGLHNHLMKNINNLLDAFGQYKDILNTTSEDLISRWENAIKNIANAINIAPEGSEEQILSKYKGMYDKYAPGLAEALFEIANKIKLEIKWKA